jgi:hypothetical protein
MLCKCKALSSNHPPIKKQQQQQKKNVTASLDKEE